MEELVSIIMPAYNAQKYIRESILSAVNQTYVNWELIIVNDGSTDDTQPIAEEFSSRDNRIKVINQENKRLGGARNTGIKNSTAKWVAFLDSDDLWEPTKLEKQIQAARALPKADVIYTSGWTFNENDLNNLMAYDSPEGSSTAAEMYNVLLAGNVIPVLSVMVKKTIIDQIGYQEEDPFFHGCEDWDYWFRMAISGANFYGLNEKLFYYRRHGNNMSGKSLQIAQAAVLLKNIAAAGMADKKETTSYLKKFVSPLITRLIAESRKTEAIYLLKWMKKIDAAWIQSVNIFLVSLMGKYSFYPVRIVMRMHKLFSKI